MKFIVSNLFLLLFVMNMTLMAENTENGDVGSFNIAKVRAAVVDLPDSASTATSSTTIIKKEESVGLLIIRITLYLGMVILLIFGIGWLVRKTGLNSARGGSGAMDIIETLPIGQNRMIIMVRVMDEIFLLSQTAATINLLDKIGGQKALDIIAISKDGGGSIVQFKDAFNSFMGKMKKPS